MTTVVGPDQEGWTRPKGQAQTSRCWGSAKLCGLWKEGKPEVRTPKAGPLARDLILLLPPGRGPWLQWAVLPWERRVEEVLVWQVMNMNFGAMHTCWGYHEPLGASVSLHPMT